VEGAEGYRTAKDFMRMIMPSHAKVVQPYAEPMPLFARFQVEGYLAGMFNPNVQLKSGGYIVIGVTEALVAIDVNSGRATKEGSIEETALKTNLEAAEEVARQLRLRDLAGLIVIDFIDMEERRNNASVEKRLKDKLKTDRARIQVGRISGFGLMEMSRQRLRPGMLESTTQPCPHCHGTGLIRSDDSLALQILRALEEEGTRQRSKEVLLKAPVAVANFLINTKREHIALIEARYGMSVRVESDPALVSPDYVIDKFKTATRMVAEAHAHVISGNMALMGAAVAEDEDEIIDDEIDEIDEVAPEALAPDARPESGTEGNGTRKKRRRRRRRKGGAGGNGEVGPATDVEDDGGDDEAGDATSNEMAEAPPVAAIPEDVAVSAAAPTKPTRTRTRSRSAKPAEPVAAEPAPEPVPAKASRGRAKAAPAPAPAPTEAVETVEAAVKPKAPARRRTPRKPKADEAAPAPEVVEASPIAATPAPVAQPDPGDSAAPEAAADAKPKRKGWWSLGR